MKKLISLAVAAVLVFSMSAVAFAAGSISDVSSSIVKVSGSAVSFESFTGNNFDAQAKVDEVNPANVYAFDVVSDESDYSSLGFTITVPGISAGDTIEVWHYTSTDASNSTKEWKQEAAKVEEDGSIYIWDITSLSPFMIMKLADTTPAPSTSSGGMTVDKEVEGGYYWNGEYYYPAATTTPEAPVTTPTTTVVASPKTGENTAVMAVMGVMLVAGVAACGLLRKEEN